MTTPVSDEMLMAYVDKALDAEAMERVRRAVEGDKSLAARAERFERSREAARTAFADILSEPPPERLVATIEGRGTDQMTGTSKRGPVAARAFMALAACLILVVGAAGGTWFGVTLNRPAGQSAPLGLRGTVATQLASVPGGQQTRFTIGGAPARMAVLGTYPIDQGVCRTFEVATQTEALRGVGCDRGTGYTVEMTVAAPPDGAQSLTTASDRTSRTLQAYLEAIGAGSPMPADQEKAILRRPGPR